MKRFPILMVLALLILAAQWRQADETGGSAPGVKAKADKELITNSIGMKLKLIRPGTFRMGSSESEDGRDNDEAPVREVTLTKPFYIGVHKVTQKEWKQVMGHNSSEILGENRAVESVTWKDTQIFLAKLSKMENAKYRLPTEAEWEYTYRAGTDTPFYWGETYDDNYAWANDNSGGKTHPLGMKKPNAWGLHDFGGNLWEWVQDWYAPYPDVAKATDPQGPPTGRHKIYRGGSCNDEPKDTRGANRCIGSLDEEGGDIGFRVVKVP